jgi:hypothetical protein
MTRRPFWPCERRALLLAASGPMIEVDGVLVPRWDHPVWGYALGAITASDAWKRTRIDPLVDSWRREKIDTIVGREGETLDITIPGGTV